MKLDTSQLWIKPILARKARNLHAQFVRAICSRNLRAQQGTHILYFLYKRPVSARYIERVRYAKAGGHGLYKL